MLSPKLYTSTALVFLLTACVDPKTTAPEPAPPPDTNLSVIATHAFGTDFTVTSVAFSPNDIASWLGTLALTTDTDTLYTTDIEGRTPKRLDTDIKTVIGLNRIQEPGAFIALTTQGDVKAYIESDDKGGFSPLFVSTSIDLSLMQLCETSNGLTDTLTAITTNGSLVTSALSITDNALLSLTSPSEPIASNLGSVLSCLSDPVLGHYILSLKNGDTTLTKFQNGGVNSITIEAAADQTSTIALMGQASDQPYLILSGANAPAGTLYDANTLEAISTLQIENGFSIMGLSDSSGVFATASAYGGSAFDSGVVVFPDSDANRLVVMSSSYLLEQANAPVDGSATQ